MLEVPSRPPRRFVPRVSLVVALTALIYLLATTAQARTQTTAQAQTPAAGQGVVSSQAADGAQPVDAGQMKAVFVVNFLRFVDWPPSHLSPAPAPIVVAVLGDRTFIEELRAYATGQSVSGHSIEVKSVDRPQDARGAHMLFIGASESGNLPAIVEVAEAAALLTVGDTEGYARAGVILNLYTLDQRIRIEANPSAATRSGVRLSAHLLRIARIVE
jgi:hypothetical protein